MKEEHGSPIVPPIHRASVFEFDSIEALSRTVGDHKKGFSYGRYDNPTVLGFESEVADLEGAERSLAFASGMAAISTAVFALLPPGGRVVRQRELYGGTVELFQQYVPRLAGEVVTVGAGAPDTMEAAIRSGADLVYLETPVNPTLDLVDLARMSTAARAVGATTLVDNTFSTPLGQRPLELGIDVSIHSATKFLGGHHDVIAGALATSEALGERIWNARKVLGGVLSPSDAFLLSRGLQTLRLRFETACDHAAALAAELATDPRVLRVLYPGLPDHPGHELAKRQMRGFGAMLAMELDTDGAGVSRFLDGLRLIKRAASLGGAQSLVMLPAGASHASLTPREREQMGISDSLIRFSIGTEPLDELRQDLEGGFRALGSISV